MSFVIDATSSQDERRVLESSSSEMSEDVCQENQMKTDCGNNFELQHTQNLQKLLDLDTWSKQAQGKMSIRSIHWHAT